MVAEFDLSALSLSCWDIILRFLAAMLVGVIIGTEREWTHRPAGMRTHMLVSLGACAVAMTSQALFAAYRPYGATPDPARLSAQVISGVGFLGAGTIIHEGMSIKGLTTAASVWAVACLGLALGAGLFMIGFTGCICIMITLIFFESVQKKFFTGRECLYSYCITSNDVTEMLELINSVAASVEAKLSSLHISHHDDGKLEISFRADFSGRHAEERRSRFFSELSEDDNTVSIRTERSRM